MATFEDKVKRLNEFDLYAIQTQYDAAIDTDHGSGEHWLLIAALNQKGFPVRSVTQAIDTAERIIILWRQLNGRSLCKRNISMSYHPKIGDIIKMHAWHGVILKIFNDETGGTVLQVQTARNVFRGYPPEFIELNVAPDAVTPATRADLEQEVQYLQRMRSIGLQEMMDSINGDQEY